MKPHTLTLAFEDAKDAQRVLDYIANAKGQDGTVGGQWPSLLCSALKRSTVATTPDLLAQREQLLEALRALTEQAGKVADCNPTGAIAGRADLIQALTRARLAIEFHSESSR